MNKPLPTATSPKSARTLKATVGVSCAALLLSFVPKFEGVVLRGYKDPIGIVTACAGHTATAVLGRPYTRAECDTLLASDLIKFADTVDQCIHVPLTTGQRAALISFAFNVGPGRAGVKDGLCVLKSGNQPQIRKRFNAGDYAGGCRALTEGWTTAGGQKLPGLVTRRAAERAMCEEK